MGLTAAFYRPWRSLNAAMDLKSAVAPEIVEADKAFVMKARATCTIRPAFLLWQQPVRRGSNWGLDV